MELYSWKKALMLRGCPPADALFGLSACGHAQACPPDERLREHLDTCPMCRENLNMTQQEREGWKTLGEFFKPKHSWDLVPSQSPLASKAPGQVWRIHRRLAGWGPKYRYYNSPRVLILESLGQGLVRVSQIAPGDDFLTPEDVQVPGLGFAQPWNVYSFSEKDLEETAILESSSMEDVARKTLERSQEPFADVDETSYLYLFRTLEIDAGSFFAGQSLAGLLARKDRITVLFAMSSEDIRHALERKGQSITLDSSENPLLQLARYAPAETLWGLAAAGGQTQSVNYALLDAMGMEIRQATVKFTSIKHEDGVLLLAGKINADFARTREVHAWWQVEGRLIRPVSEDISENGFYFTLRFEDVSDRDFRVGRLLALFSGDEETA